MHHPALALELPRLGEYADVIFTLVIVFHEGLHDVLPLTIDGA